MRAVASKKTNKQQRGVEKLGFMTAMLSRNENYARFQNLAGQVQFSRVSLKLPVDPFLGGC
jgi:hypothetical protein